MYHFLDWERWREIQSLKQRVVVLHLKQNSQCNSSNNEKLVGSNFTNRNTMIDKPPHQDSKEACAQVQLIHCSGIHVKHLHEGGSSPILRIHLVSTIMHTYIHVHDCTKSNFKDRVWRL